MAKIEDILKNQVEITPELKKKYWDGKANHFIRHYFYVTKGLALFNEFRYIVMSVGMIYVFFKLENPLFLPLMFVLCMPPLDFAGWLSVHKMDKVTEFLQTRYATHYSHYNIELQEKQLESLKRIEEKLNSKDFMISRLP